MKPFAFAVLLALATMIVSGCANAPANIAPPAASATAVKLMEPMPGLYTAGQPAATDWTAIKAHGVHTVINLRTPGEMQGRDEAAEVRAAGMQYITIPVAGADGINQTNARALHDALASTHASGVLVHCSSGNRAGALLALEQADFNGVPKARALELGKKAGVTSLAAKLQQALDAGK